MPSGNFEFLNPDFSQFYAQAHKAENYLFKDPEVCAFCCRKALEEMVFWLFETDRQLDSLYEDEEYSLASLMHKPSFIRLVGQQLFTDINAIRKAGNIAAHRNQKKKITQKDAFTCIINLHAFTQWLVYKYKGAFPAEPFNINRTGEKLPQGAEHLANIPLAEPSLAQADDGISYKSPSEQLTRELYIDVLLKEAGWDTQNNDTKKEYVLTHSAKGLDRADYVLFGDDGVPLAVVEAKKTTVDGRDKGLQQAKRYADALESRFGRRPIIFSTNGFEHYIWDDHNYPYRQVQGFYAKEDLQTLQNRKFSLLPLASQAVNTHIAGRYYQINAIQSAKESLEKGRRDILFIMATGSGKTRTAAALVDVLTKANWVKRILFLADRNPLVSQAKNSFKDYLPQLSSVNLGKDKNSDQVRMVFSTYQTMINCIDKEEKDGHKRYTVGYFDLVIFDEVHRSIYQKYKAIFDYFDAIRLGLTATPKEETHRDTFELFKLETNVPTFAYELDQAVDDGFLTPPVAIKVPLKFLRQGIKYQELSIEDKQKYEETFARSSEGLPEEIESSALNKWLFNKNTVNQVLKLLMDSGLKVNDGETIGKTIIFAKNQAHARFIENCFNEAYPNLKGYFLQVITHSSDQPEDKIDAFREAGKLPQIAVSVDMLDTGIDVPDILNLVFLKEVKSSAKYWQMVGRGTRLCADVFGKGQHKAHFYIFDYCGNFEFFGANPKGIEPGLTLSLTQRVFQLKVQLAKLLESFVEDDDLNVYREILLDDLHAELLALDRQSFVNRPYLELLERFGQRNYWNNLTDVKVHDLETRILVLLIGSDPDFDAKRFDVISYSLMIDFLSDQKMFVRNAQTVKEIAFQLLKQTTIPQVVQKQALLKSILTEVFWQNADLQAIENLRKELRGLLKFLEKEGKEVFYTNLKDELTGEIERFSILKEQSPSYALYHQRLASFIRKHSNYIVISKIKNNEPISTAELAQIKTLLFKEDPDTASHLDEVLNGKDFMQFIRSIIGLNVNIAKQLFAEFINRPGVNTSQIHFINTLISYLSRNGTINQAMLFERPFTDIDQNGILGLFEEDDARRIISILDRFNGGASVG